MTHCERFGSLSVTARLRAGAALSALPLGFVWPDVAGGAIRVSQVPVRVFLVFAALALAGVSARTRTATSRRVARAATVALCIAAVLAVSAGARATVICTVLALILAMPAVWDRSRVLATRAAPR